MMLRTASILATVVLLGGIFGQSMTFVRSGDTAPYHARVAEAIGQIPARFGTWESREAPIPASAQVLLRPNAAVCRQYRDVQSGLVANLIVIQTRDPRDMSGHYPKNCYPRSGWTMSTTEVQRDFMLAGVRTPVMVYEFVRNEYGSSPHIVVYNFFVMPFKGLRPDMRGVRRATGDFRRRPYGAAQVQVIMEATVAPETRDAVFRRFMEEVMPAVGIIADPNLATGGGAT